MKTKNPGSLIWLSIFAGVMLAGCSTPVYVQKDDAANMSNYKTYMWVDTRASETDNSERPSSYADIPVRNAVNNELRSMGWREVSDNPDALLSYDILVERSVEQKNDPVYSRPVTRSFYNPYTRRWSTIYYPSQFLGYQSYEVPVKEGTVTISIIDARNDKTVWQGWTTETMNYNRFSSDEIARSVRSIFNKFDETTASR